MPRSSHAILLVPILLLAACGGSSNSGGGGGPNPPGPPGPPSPPTTVQTQQVFAGVNLSLPTSLVQAPNDASRWFAIEKAGRIIVFDNTVNATGSTFLDIRGRVDSGPSEAGLLGIAFHPDFAINGEVFVSYTALAGPLTSVISRFSSFPGNQMLDPTSEEVILTVIQPFGNHNGGDIAFGPDGYLYAGFGDGGSGGDPNGNGQNTTTLLGSMVRINVDAGMGYDIPFDNPFEGGAKCSPVPLGGDCPEIYAWGFRNPWRFSFDSLTGDLWVGDVGQGEWEEVDRVNLGANYGWNVREGANCFEPPNGCGTNFVDPITEYANSGGSSITGGYVYRGNAIPILQGQYLFADFPTGRIWAVAADSPIGTTPIEIARTGYLISAFGEGVDGELYVFDYFAGTIHQIVP